MTEALVWMLIAVSGGGSNHGTVTFVGNFKSEVQCEHVRKAIVQMDYLSAKCIQANVLVPK